VTTYRFRLRRVLDFRRTQFQVAEAGCRRAVANLAAIESERLALAERKSETQKQYALLSQSAGEELAPLTPWYHWTATESDRLVRLEQVARQELQKRLEILIEAQRKVRLLEKLDHRRHSEWQAAFDKEIEELAADSTASRYGRDLLS